MTMTARPQRYPDEIAITDARPIIGELADAASHGQIIYLTRRGERIAALVPADPRMTTDADVTAIARSFIAAHAELFERLANA